MVRSRDDIEGLDSAILMHPRVWEASGHVGGFVDPLVDCKVCKGRFRADKLQDAQCVKKPSKKPGEHSECQLTEPRQFNLMFETYVGAVRDEDSKAYLRPETAQGMFVDFPLVQTVSRKKLPFGIAQIGKAFRNEITPGNFIFRTREFELMEVEYFVEPGTDDVWFPYWVNERLQWYLDLGVTKEKLRIRPHEPDELAHYAKAASDVEYEFPFGWQEVEGIANRTDYDLKAHQEASGEDLTYFDQEKDERYLPFVVEPAVGVDRLLLTFLIDAYTVDEAPTAKGDTEKRTVLKLHRDLAPIKVAVLPLSRNETLVPEARRVFDLVKPEWMCQYDDAGAIGRRYRRQDEVGTPFCVTVDFDSLEDRQVTVRERDTMSQDRIPIEDLVAYLRDRL
jgi:glycyl-tRNA synthetase